MNLANLAERIEFEIDGEIYSVEPCFLVSFCDEESGQKPGLQINFPNEEIIQVGLYNFLDLHDLKKFVISQLTYYKLS